LVSLIPASALIPDLWQRRDAFSRVFQRRHRMRRPLASRLVLHFGNVEGCSATVPAIRPISEHYWLGRRVASEKLSFDLRGPSRPARVYVHRHAIEVVKNWLFKPTAKPSARAGPCAS
jgi:hypothetical protein